MTQLFLLFLLSTWYCTSSLKIDQMSKNQSRMVCKTSYTVGKEQLYKSVLIQAFGEIDVRDGWWFRLPCVDYSEALQEKQKLVRDYRITLFINYKLYFRRKVHSLPFSIDDNNGCHGKPSPQLKFGHYDAQTALHYTFPLSYDRNRLLLGSNYVAFNRKYLIVR